MQKAGRFILATNILDLSKLSNDDMLLKYKEQQSKEKTLKKAGLHNGSQW